MNKAVLIKQMAEMANISEEIATKALNAFVDSSKLAIEAGDQIEFEGLGLLSFSDRSSNAPDAKSSEETVAFEQNQPLVNEPVMSYLFPINEHITKAELLRQLDGKIESCQLIDELLETTGLPLKILAEKVFEMTPKTLTSYRQKGRFLPKRSVESIIKLKELYLKGMEIFETQVKFNQWLTEPAYGLSLKLPLSFISSSTGIDLIYEELLKIEFGATA